MLRPAFEDIESFCKRLHKFAYDHHENENAPSEISPLSMQVHLRMVEGSDIYSWQ